MWFLGSLAADLTDELKASDWPSAKRAIDAPTYDALLRAFEAKGNEHHQAGRTKPAYAIQAMAISLVARTQNADPQIAAGEPLLDQLIDAAAKAFRHQQVTRPN
jgi:hypothetical protein